MSNYLNIAISTLAFLAAPFFFSILLSVTLGVITALYVLGNSRIKRAIGFCAMFGGYGVALGFFAGASKEPIIGTILSTVVTFVSGYFIHIMSKDMNPRLKSLIPSAVLSFIFSLLYTATYVVKVNTAM